MSALFRPLLCATGAMLAAGAFAAAPPNILVILTDDQGSAEFSAVGTPGLRTPHVDRLFREGIGFRNFRANSCVCSPTRAALLTGLNPDRAGVPGVIRSDTENSWGSLAPAAVLLPQALKAAGYHSALVGKWHLGLEAPNLPNMRGFDFFHGFLGDMMSDYWTHLRSGKNLMRRDAAVIDPRGHATDLFTDWAVDYIETRAREPQWPFFLLLAYNAPHDPVQPPPEWLAKVQAREPALPERRAKLVALIEHLDDGIGRVLATLDRTGLAARTLVIFTSDNGGELDHAGFNGTLRSGKRHMYEGGLRVPFAARWPGVIPPGAGTAAPAQTMDIFATACAAAGVAPPPDLDAVNLLPLLRGEAPPAGAPPRELYFVCREGNVRNAGLGAGGQTIEALIRGDWKIIHDSPTAPRELYNLRSDPHETTNLAAQEPAIFAEMAALLMKHVKRGGAVPWQPPTR